MNTIRRLLKSPWWCLHFHGKFQTGYAVGFKAHSFCEKCRRWRKIGTTKTLPMMNGIAPETIRALREEKASSSGFYGSIGEEGYRRYEE